jgi:hypothetical protein
MEIYCRIIVQNTSVTAGPDDQFTGVQARR